MSSAETFDINDHDGPVYRWSDSVACATAVCSHGVTSFQTTDVPALMTLYPQS